MGGTADRRNADDGEGAGMIVDHLELSGIGQARATSRLLCVSPQWPAVRVAGADGPLLAFRPAACAVLVILASSGHRTHHKIAEIDTQPCTLGPKVHGSVSISAILSPLVGVSGRQTGPGTPTNSVLVRK
jgi:hypothetical protein